MINGVNTDEGLYCCVYINYTVFDRFICTVCSTVDYSHPKARNSCSHISVSSYINRNGLFQLMGIHPHRGVNFDLSPKKA